MITATGNQMVRTMVSRLALKEQDGNEKDKARHKTRQQSGKDDD